MRGARLRRRRAGAQRVIRLALAAVVLVGSGTAAGVAGYLAAATDAGARTTLADASGDAPNLSPASGPARRAATMPSQLLCMPGRRPHWTSRSAI